MEAQRRAELDELQLGMLKAELRHMMSEIHRDTESVSREYLRNITVQYLETSDPSLIPALEKALLLSRDEVNRISRGRGSWLSGFLPV